ncbi:hypothetical protein [Marinimicrobium sp. ABcell2]|uniref:hypothetical protein n=1 Tax=Marinimicrobium sp. ABcell2 TaxID=3069751 RepID=UPI0027AF0902|nr:hypothetical protein [Marinimicrobium sp. ABcell2]MDQ2077489.1 hypothetical protein [Marinimicrobium sp. ABcell2]
MKTVDNARRNRWGYNGRLLNVVKTDSKVISPGLIEASERSDRRLSDGPNTEAAVNNVEIESRSRWGYSGRLLNVIKTDSKVISPGLIEASNRSDKRLSDDKGPRVVAW